MGDSSSVVTVTVCSDCGCNSYFCKLFCDTYYLIIYNPPFSLSSFWSAIQLESLEYFLFNCNKSIDINPITTSDMLYLRTYSIVCNGTKMYQRAL